MRRFVRGEAFDEQPMPNLAADALRVPPLSTIGSPIELAGRFGGSEALNEAIIALRDERYAVDVAA